MKSQKLIFKKEILLSFIIFQYEAIVVELSLQQRQQRSINKLLMIKDTRRFFSIIKRQKIKKFMCHVLLRKYRVVLSSLIICQVFQISNNKHSNYCQVNKRLICYSILWYILQVCLRILSMNPVQMSTAKRKFCLMRKKNTSIVKNAA